MGNSFGISEVIYICSLVATFLLNSNRVYKVFELCKECLIVLDNQPYGQSHGQSHGQSLFLRPIFYFIMFEGYLLVNDHKRWKECGKKCLDFFRAFGNRNQESWVTIHLGKLCQFKRQFKEAEQFYEKALRIMMETGNRSGEAMCYSHLGNTFHFLNKYGKAEEYQKKALVIAKEIGGRDEEASCYKHLGITYESLGEFAQAEAYLEKALMIYKEIGDKRGEAASYSNLGAVKQSLGEYGKAEEYQMKALEIRKEIGDGMKVARSYQYLGVVYHNLCECVKAEEYHTKALLLAKEHCLRDVEASSYANLGTLFRSTGKYTQAKEYHHKALALSKDIGDRYLQLQCHLLLAYDAFLEGDTVKSPEANLNLLEGLQMCEEMRSSLREHDRFKISLLDQHSDSYRLLSTIFCSSRDFKKAFSVVELGRARALADLMFRQYSVSKQIAPSPQSWGDINRIMEKESTSTCLYMSYFGRFMFVWVFKDKMPKRFRAIDVNEWFESKGSKRNVAELLSEETFRKCRGFPSHGQCEDRSLFVSNAHFPVLEFPKQGSTSASRPVEEEEDESKVLPNLVDCYQMIIAPVADVLEGPELIIVPDRFLYKVPFAALTDEHETYLSDKYMIRIIPSLTTLKLIQDSPADYHSQDGALIVGDPDVGGVLYKGSTQKLSALPFARKEAEIIARLVGADPLIGTQATKQAVLQNIHSVSLIHFAAHGNAESGEIALAPRHPIDGGIPQEKDYLLTMADISQVQLRAKLVVLSCCHSARGQIRSEGVVGIARAFLGSGARSVLVALWAIPDEATKEFMSRFYEHLVRGQSASESLQLAMKWMRSNGYTDESDWAPFMLIGDNVSIDFGIKNNEGVLP